MLKIELTPLKDKSVCRQIIDEKSYTPSAWTDMQLGSRALNFTTTRNYRKTQYITAYDFFKHAYPSIIITIVSYRKVERTSKTQVRFVYTHFPRVIRPVSSSTCGTNCNSSIRKFDQQLGGYFCRCVSYP
jgi:hypothetical protein